MQPMASTSGSSAMERSWSPFQPLLGAPLLVGRGGLEIAGVACKGVLSMESLVRNGVVRSLAGLACALGPNTPAPATTVPMRLLTEHTTFTQTSNHAARRLKSPRHVRSARQSKELSFRLHECQATAALQPERMAMENVLGLQASML